MSAVVLFIKYVFDNNLICIPPHFAGTLLFIALETTESLSQKIIVV